MCVQRIKCITSLPHLSLIPSLDSIESQLLNGLNKVLKECSLVCRICLDEPLRPVVGDQSMVRIEQPQAPGEVLEVHVVEFAGGHDIIKGGHGGVLVIGGTSLLQPLGIAWVQGGVIGLGVAVIVDSVRELAAVGEANGVGTRKRNHVAYREALFGKEGDQIGHGHGGLGQVALYIGNLGRDAVLAPQGDIVEGASHLFVVMLS